MTDVDSEANAALQRLNLKPRKSFSAQKSFEDHLFDVLSDGKDAVPASKIIQGMRKVGIHENDPRLQETMTKLHKLQEEGINIGVGRDVLLDRETFCSLIMSNIVLIKRIFTVDFIIPDFHDFCNIIKRIYEQCVNNCRGKPADYIPQLARFDPNYWAVSVCTVDGQRFSIGDTQVPFCLQSTSKPLNYALALSDLGEEKVHQYVGHEPSGEHFNVIKLNPANRPHNPMINAGAIAVAALLKYKLSLADRFDYTQAQYRRMAGGEFLGFNNTVFLSERATADRNFALGYYLRENKCFPEGSSLVETLEFYFQLCSVEVNADSGSVIAATLANGGICPITAERVLDGDAVKNTLSLMLSCGMYDYSGEFAFKCGLPGKSGVSGAILLVVPNVMGMCLWSPPLDELGNSCRGLQFCEELVRTFNFHHYDSLKHSVQKLDPRRRQMDKEGVEVTMLLFSAAKGDLTELRRMTLSGVDMRQADYDGRTALHLAAAEGHLDCVKFLLEVCSVPVNPRDRWGQIPLDDAGTFGRTEVIEYLQQYEDYDK